MNACETPSEKLHSIGIARSALALLLTATLCCFGTPAFATEADATSPATQHTVGTGAGARTVEELLAAGSYVDGHVLARVTSEFNPVVPYSNDGAFSIDKLYAYSAAEADTGDASGGEVRALSAEGGAPDRVVLIESNAQSTEELLRSLIGTPGVVMAEPDYVGTLDDPVADEASDGTEVPAALSEVATADSAEPSDANPLAAGPNDPLFSSQYFLQNTADVVGGTNAQALWSKLWSGTPSSASIPEDQQVVIAVLDSGVDAQHPDLKDVMWDGGKSVAPWSGTYGYDFADNDDTPQDDAGHGTHVAGIVAAATNNRVGGAGMAPNARIMALRATGEKDSFRTSWVVKAYQYVQLAEAKGIHVAAVNNSWGASEANALLASVMEDLYQTYGTLSVCASGNAGSDHDVKTDTPSGLLSESIIAVNATDKNGDMASISDYGSVTTDIAAPGERILSTSIDRDAALWDMDESKLAFRETFDTEEQLIEYSPVEGAGFSATTLELKPEADAAKRAGGSGLLWSTDVLTTGTTVAIDMKALDIDLGGNPPTTVAFDAFGSTTGGSLGGMTMSRYINVYMAAIDGGWTRINEERTDTITDGTWKTIVLPVSKDASNEINWKEPAIRIERIFADHEVGSNVTFSIDNVTLAYDGAYTRLPYVSSTGTSMATPVISGAIALLAKAYPNDSAATLKARVLGSVVRDGKLTGTCTTDGRLDLSRTDNPYPVIENVAQDEGDPSRIVVKGAFFGNTPGTLSVEGIGSVETTSWSDTEVRATLPEGIDTAQRYVTVERSGGQDTGRLRVYLEGTSATANEAFFDSLPAPDLASLGVDVISEQSSSWKVAEAGGTIFATAEYIGKQNPAANTGKNEPESFMRMLAFDPNTLTWSIDERFNAFARSSYLMCSHEGQLYLLNTGSYEVHRYDPATGSLDLLFNLSNSYLTGVYFFNLGGLSCDGQRLWVVGEIVTKENGETAGGTATATIDLATGQVQAGPSLSIGRALPSIQFVDDALTLAAGFCEVETLEPTTDRLVDGKFQPMASLPSSVRLDQLCTAASAVLPTDSVVVTSDGASITLESECMIVSGLVSTDPATNPVDTYLYDPRANTWTGLQKQLSPVKTCYAGGTLYNGAFYVLSFDATGSTGNADGLVFKSLKVKEAPSDPEPSKPVDPEVFGPVEPETPKPLDGASNPAKLAPTGDSAPETAVSLAAFAALAGALGVWMGARRRRGTQSSRR